MVTGAAIDQRVGTAGVVAHHATNTATVAGRCFWAEKETIRLQVEV